VLSGLMIEGGRFPTPGNQDGGGIRNAGNLTVRNCDIVGNGFGAFAGGGIYSQGTLVLNDVTVVGNYSLVVGGIDSSGSLAMTNCEIRDNQADYGCAGIACGGRSVLNNVVVGHNISSGPATAGIKASGDLTLINCALDGNLGDWGCITFYGNNLYILNSSISDSGSSLEHAAGSVSGTNIVIVNSTIANNRDNSPGFELSGSISMSNCTVFGNYYGGGIHNGGTLNLVNCTVSGNYSARASAIVFPAINNSGIIAALSCTIVSNKIGVANSGTFFAENTIIADNMNADFAGVLVSQGFNLIGNLTNTTVIGDTTGNIYGVDPLLGPLQDNGGPTWTHALLPGSPAIDAGTSGGLTTDQRGMPRPYDVPCIPNASDGSDIGAYEWTPTATASEDVVMQAYVRSEVELLLLKVTQSGLSHPRPLVATLRAALASIDRGNANAAANQLHAFQNKIAAQVVRSNPVVAQTLVQAAAEVIDSLNCSASGSGPGALAPKVHSVKRQPNGKVQLSFSAPALQAPIVEASTNLVDWEAIGVALDQGNGLFQFDDTNAAKFSSRFYRIR
jgi:hypothetical protein